MTAFQQSKAIRVFRSIARQPHRLSHSHIQMPGSLDQGIFIHTSASESSTWAVYWRSLPASNKEHRFKLAYHMYIIVILSQSFRLWRRLKEHRNNKRQV